MSNIILASKSPRRQELLHHMGLHDFQICGIDADESCPEGLPAREVVAHISRNKALAAKRLVDENSIVITADTLVFLGDKRLGKPHDEVDALSMLTALQGNRHTVCTGVTVQSCTRAVTFTESTDVIFRAAAREELLAYIRSGEPMDKAGAYGAQGLGALLIERFEGDYFNVVGLPIMRLSLVLREFGVDLLR